MRTLLTALIVLALATPAMAAFKGPGTEPAPQVMGGFKGPHSMGVTKASQVAAAHDDTPVNLTGHLVEQLGPYKYTFRDETGSVVVDIDQRKFRGQTVTPETQIRIVGEVDYDHGNKEVDVDYLEVLR